MKVFFTQKGVAIKYIPSNSPEYNPREMMWSKVKAHARKKWPRDFLSLWREISIAQLNVTPEDAQEWYKEAGYCH